VGFHVPYIASSLLYAVVLAAVFFTWQRTEHTLSIHSIDTPRREAFYWAAVVATFAMGTALGDLTSVTFGLGYFVSGILFSALILIPAIGYRWFGMNSILAFWIAYVLTRPVGASFADWFGKPTALHGLGYGPGPVAGVLLVAFLAITHADVQQGSRPQSERDRQRHTARDRVR
jgi:uncharacterized membrane-anchored protein